MVGATLWLLVGMATGGRPFVLIERFRTESACISVMRQLDNIGYMKCVKAEDVYR